MSQLASRRVVIAMLAAAALLGLVSSADAGSGIAILALATVPALIAVPPRARGWLGAAVIAIGVSAGALGDLSGDLWAWCSIVALVLAGTLIVVGGRTWPGLSGRYSPSVDSVAAGAPDHDPTELWRELDRGRDPTLGRRDTTGRETPPDDVAVD